MNIRYLIAMNSEGKFFGLDESFSSTSPKIVDHPYYAKLITPYDEDDFENPKPATYYFENSERMRRWLVGFIMVSIVMNVEYSFS